MRIRVTAVGLVALAAVLAGCASVVDGTGSTALGSRSTPPAGPTGGAGTSAPAPPAPSSTPGSASKAAAPTPCPHVAFPAAKLSFDCIVSNMIASYGGSVWPLSEHIQVESTGWVLEEGAGHWGAPNGSSLGAIARNVRQQMLDDEDYGASPRVTTASDADTKVAGVPAHVLQSTMTINAAWAKKRGTRVRQEKLWIIALQVGADDVSLWYVSVPDLAKALWPKVPSVIATIKVG